MKFLLNGLTLGGSSNVKIESPIEGLETAPVRVGDGDWSGRDGGYVSSQFYGSRVIVINGWYAAGTCEQADDIRAEIAASLKIRQSLPLFITTFSNRIYFAQTYLRDFKMDIIGPKNGKFRITLIAPDALLYDAGDGIDPDSGWQEQDVYKLVGGGYVTEYEVPVQWTPGTTPTVIANSGDAYINPQIKISGETTNPRITNLTENKFIQVNISTAPGDELIIDLSERTITLNGSSVLSFRTLDSNWWGLSPGNNTIDYSSSSGDDVDFVTVRWRNGYIGI